MAARRRVVALGLIGIAAFPRQALGMPPACSPATGELTVRNPAGLAALVQQANCSEGTFQVFWEGEVVFGEPIVVGNATTLTIVGTGAGAVLDGGGVTRLVEAAGGSSLFLENVELRNGSAPLYTGGGGAIASDGAEITIQATSCNFTGNTSPYDGGALISTGGLATVRFTGCRFEGNTAGYNGGAARVDSASELTALNTVFLENVALDEGYSSFGGYGGALHVSGGAPEISFESCAFLSNNASAAGGAVYHDAGGSVGLNDTRVVKNWARYHGGGVYATGGVTKIDVTRSVFEENIVSNKESWGRNFYDGGGLGVNGEAQVTVRSTAFNRNGAENGGGLLLRGNNSVAIEDCVFEENLASVYGALVITTFGAGRFDAALTNTTFVGNWCGGSAGAMFAHGEGNVSFVETTFRNNSVIYRNDLPNVGTGSHRGGGYHASGAGLYTLARSCLFESNTAGAAGGAVAVDGGTFSSTECEFLDNAAGYRGGALSASDADDGLDGDEYGSPSIVYLRSGAMLRNTVWGCYSNPWPSCGYGGALRADSGSEAILYDMEIAGNSAEIGGGISVAEAARVSCTSVNISSNAAGEAGGGLHVWGNDSRFVADDSFFGDNAALATGSSTDDSAASSSSTAASTVASDGGSSSASSSTKTPTRDVAGAAGGAVSASDGGSVFLTDSELSGNSADGRGGGVFCGVAANVTLRRTDLEGHRSAVGGNGEAHGGAFAAVEGCRVLLEDSTFAANRALGPSGGAVSAESSSDVTAERCIFSENQASGGGALYGAGAETRIAMVDCTVEGNRASKEGGALRAYQLGVLRTDSCNFHGNYAGELGGGIHCYECNLWTTNCTFTSNSANGDGGAMRLSYASNAKLDRCHFDSNSAVYDGGAIAVDAAVGRVGSVEQLTAASQPQNETGDDGVVDLDCYNTTFEGNTAGERGGSLYSTAESEVELQDCNSTGNSASLGGTIYMAGSDYSLIRCIFAGDTVPTEATIFAVGASLDAREVTFEDTTNNSGMLSVYVGSGADFEAQNCSFVGWVGSNVVLAASTGKLRLDSCDFTESSASTLVAVESGGSSTELAIVTNARLSTGNYEAINYGIGSVSTGDNASLFGVNVAGCDSSACSDGCVEGDLGVYCACFENILDFSVQCLGKSGKLTLTSPTSEVSTTYPDDPLSNISLASNDTEEDGPVLWKLDWTDDPSSVAWTAVPSAGLAYPGESTKISLQGSVAKKWNGKISTAFTAEAPHQEDVEASVAVVNATFVYCTAGEFWDGDVGQCYSCAGVDLNPEGVECDEAGYLLETLPISPGYWRAIVTSTTIRECFNDNACVGSVDGMHVVSVNDYCAVGYNGPYCAVCVSGYTIGVSHTCHSCDSSFRAGMVVIMALTGVILLGGIVIVINDLVGNPALTDLSETPFSAVSRRLRRIPFHKLKIPLVVFQIMTQYASITSIEFPPVFQTFLSAISVINLDLGWLFTAVCMIDFNFHGRLLAATLGPLGVLLVLLGTYVYTCKKHGLRPPPREIADQAMFPVPGFRASPHSSETEPEHSVLRRVQDKHTTVALTMAFLLYSTVSTVVFQTFTCDDIEDIEKRYLRADYSIDCDSGRHKFFEVYAGIMILIYPIGIPIVFLVLLFRKRKIINPPKEVHPDVASLTDEQSESEGHDLDPRLIDRRIAQTAFLWRAYRPGAYYFEVMECFRRLLLTGCLVFILPNSAGQAAVACVLSVLTVGIFALVHPFSDPDDHRAYTLGALAVFLTMFMGLVVRVDLADEETQSQDVLATLLILLTVGLLIVAIGECLWEARRLSMADRNEVQDKHVYLRGDVKAKDGAGDEKYKTGGGTDVPKLLDVPMNRAFGAKNSNNSDPFDEKAFAAGGGRRQRGTKMFMLSSSADPDHKPHVAIAGTSSQQHPSEAGVAIPPSFSSTYRGSGGLGVGVGPDGLKSFQSSSGSHSPIHSRRGEHVRRDSGGGLVPAEAESAPDGMEMDTPVSAGGSVGGAGAAGGGSRQNSTRSKRPSRSSRREGGRSSRRRARDGGRVGMRPAMPAAGPMDEMRLSPDPTDAHPPGPWIS